LKSNRAVLLLGFCASVLVAVCAISSNSLWVDEFGTWRLTRASSTLDWWGQIQTVPSSDSQIPLYHFFMYMWTNAFGEDAFVMRASNVALFAVANLALLWPFRSRPTVAFPILLTACLSAPLWYYLNEIRPYMMLYAGMCLMIGATIELIRSHQIPSSVGIYALCIGAVLSSGASVLGIAWAGSIALFILLYWLTIRKSSLRDLLDNNYLILVIAVLCIAVLLVHDLRMFARGALPSLHYESNVLTLLFSFYTNLGLIGVGPGMLDFRANGASALVSFLPILTFSTIVFGLVAIAGMFAIKSMVGMRTMLLLIGLILLPVLFTFAIGLGLHWRVLPRHLIQLVPLFSLLYAFGLAWWWRYRLVGKAVVMAWVIMMAYSSISVRYDPRHAKDDYKHASELAAIELARGGIVWWAAEPAGAFYYNIPFVVEAPDWPQGPSSGMRIASWKTFSFLSAQEAPTLVLLSRPETYDEENVIRKYLAANKYYLAESFPAFTAWRR
jgi:hypothetical protein